MSAGPMVPRAARVTGTRRETYDTVTLEVEASSDDASFEPGQFDMLYAFGVGEAAISISGALAGPARRQHTIREVGPVTRALGRLEPGDEVGVRGPFGAPWPLERATGRDVVFVAGGIGLAPLRPAMRAVLQRRDQHGRVAILCGARTPADLLYPDELDAWRASPGVTVLTTVDRGDEHWQGATGVVTKLLPRMDVDPTRAVAFSCGPEVMMRFAARELVRLGVSTEDLFLSLERNMSCAVGTCGHCMLGGTFVCKDGPVLPYPRVARLLSVAEL